MLPLTIVGLLCGIVLALRFNVFVLIPAVFIGALVALGSSMAVGATVGTMGLSVVLVITALQLGYLLGSFARYASLAVMLRNRRLHVKATTRLNSAQ